jgi:hypothetical protein
LRIFVNVLVVIKVDEFMADGLSKDEPCESGEKHADGEDRPAM